MVFGGKSGVGKCNLLGKYIPKLGLNLQIGDGGKQRAVCRGLAAVGGFFVGAGCSLLFFANKKGN